MFWLVIQMKCCLQHFQLWLSVGGQKPVLVSKGVSAHSLLSHFFPVLGFLPFLCCDAPECLMAEPPGRPAGAWRSPVESWVSGASSLVFQRLPTCITHPHMPADMGWTHQPLLVRLIMFSWLHGHWRMVWWEGVDVCVSYFWHALGQFPLERWLCVRWIGRIYS